MELRKRSVHMLWHRDSATANQRSSSPPVAGARSVTTHSSDDHQSSSRSRDLRSPRSSSLSSRLHAVRRDWGMEAYKGSERSRTPSSERRHFDHDSPPIASARSFGANTVGLPARDMRQLSPPPKRASSASAALCERARALGRRGRNSSPGRHAGDAQSSGSKTGNHSPQRRNNGADSPASSQAFDLPERARPPRHTARVELRALNDHMQGMERQDFSAPASPRSDRQHPFSPRRARNGFLSPSSPVSTVSDGKELSPRAYSLANEMESSAWTTSDLSADLENMSFHSNGTPRSRAKPKMRVYRARSPASALLGRSKAMALQRMRHSPERFSRGSVSPTRANPRRVEPRPIVTEIGRGWAQVLPVDGVHKPYYWHQGDGRTQHHPPSSLDKVLDASGKSVDGHRFTLSPTAISPPRYGHVSVAVALEDHRTTSSVSSDTSNSSFSRSKVPWKRRGVLSGTLSTSSPSLPSRDAASPRRRRAHSASPLRRLQTDANSFVKSLKEMSPRRASRRSRFQQPGSDLAGPSARRDSSEFVAALRRMSPQETRSRGSIHRLSLSPVRQKPRAARQLIIE